MVNAQNNQRCLEGDYVCQLVLLHTSGQLTSSRLTNITNQIEHTWQRSINVDVTLSQLHQNQHNAETQMLDVRAHLYNNKNHTDREVDRLAQTIALNQDYSKSTAKELEKFNEKQTNTSSEILKRLEHEMVRVNETLQRDASEQIKEKRRIAELEEKKALWEIEREKLHRDEAREKLLEADRRVAEAENRTQQLAKDRIDYENEKVRERDEETTKLKEASEARQEALRRETEEALIRQRAAAELEKANVEIEIAIAKAKAEAEGQIKRERDNEDIKLRLQKSESDAQRRQVLDSINLIFVRIADGGRDIVSDPERLLRLLGAVILLAAGVYFVREFSKVVAREIERRLGKPSLVRDTSRRHATGLASSLWESCARLFAFLKKIAMNIKMSKNTDDNDDDDDDDDDDQVEVNDDDNHNGQHNQKLHHLEHFEDVILEKDCASRIMELALASKNAQKNRAPYRHLLFYGPAGTGKSMVAKRLALHSGMDWAIMSGGDVGPLGEQAVTDLHHLFAWARSSTNGLMLFIDEAEAFLSSRSRGAHTIHMRNALNALLFQTGDQSRHFMLVLATNRAADLDAAVLDRIDEAVHFGLPRSNERLNIASQYFQEHVLNRVLSKSKNVWYKGGGAIRSLRTNMDTLLCQQSSVIFGSGFTPSKQISLCNFDNVGNNGSDTEEHSEEDEEVLMEEQQEQEEQEMTLTTSSSSSKKKASSRRRAKTPIRKRKRKSTRTPKKTTPKNDSKKNQSQHYTSLSEKIGDIECPKGTLKGIEFYMRKTARITKQFSGRQLAKMMISCQGMVYGTEASTLTPKSYWTLVQRKVDEHKRKLQMAKKKSRDDNAYNYA